MTCNDETRKKFFPRSKRKNPFNRKMMKLLSLLIVLCIFSVRIADAAKGCDMSQEECEQMTLTDWQNLVADGFSFTIIQTFQGGYQLNKDIARCVSDAWKAGMAHVDVYVFMCPECDGNVPSSSAMDRIVDFLQQQNVTYGMMWFDIEQCDGCWSDFNTNIQFIQEAANQAVKRGQKIGFYSSEYEWGQTVGSDCKAFSQYPLWYAHWDQQTNFNDGWAYQFGGWTTPSIKQYYDHGPANIGVDVDEDWYP